MKIEFTSLETEPLVYFLFHSAAFVTGLAVVFFMLGLWFGALTWGRFRKKNKVLQTELEEVREEVAVLKRKLAEQVMRPSTGPLGAPAPALLTEGLPKPSEIFPERSTAPEPLLPSEPVEDNIPSLPLIPELAPIPGITPVRTVQKRVSSQEENVPLSVPSAKPSRESTAVDSVEPFSFLLPDAPDHDEEDEAAAQDHESLLGSIIHAESNPHPLEAMAPPTLIPENDPSLGMIYKEKPADVDDLTRVQGISPALQNRLQELGIYRLQQIAGWSLAHIREFSRRLAFKDRIERERWVEQARRLMDG